MEEKKIQENEIHRNDSLYGYMSLVGIVWMHIKQDLNQCFTLLIRIVRERD